MDTRRLQTFVRIVEIGSLTRAADVLHVAQPALSQQISALEAELGQRLLTRSKQGVHPTEAGAALYRHAQVILKQVSDAVAEVGLSGREVAGHVSLGLAPYSSANLIALPLLRAVRSRYPRIVLRVTDNFGAVLSEAMMTGRLDMALLFDSGPIKGITFERLLTEELVLVCGAGNCPGGGELAGREQDDVASLGGEPVGEGVHGGGSLREVSVGDLADLPMLMTGPTHTIRKAVARACEASGIELNVVAELESVGLMGQALAAGLGATLLPESVAQRVAEQPGLRILRVTPAIEVHLSLGVPASLPLSRAAECVRDLLRQVLAETL